MDKTTIVAHAVRVPFKRFGTPMDDIDLMEKVNNYAPKMGLYGVNPNMQNLCVHLIYMTRKQASFALDELRKHGIKCELVKEPCHFDASVLSDESQEIYKQEAKEAGADEALNLVELIREERKEAYKWKSQADLLQQKLNDLEQTVTDKIRAIKNLLEKNKALGIEVERIRSDMDALQRHYEHRIEELLNKIKMVEDEDDVK